MKLVPYDRNKINNVDRYYSKSANHVLLMEFINSDMDCAKVENYPHKTSTSCAASLARSVKRYGFNSIKVRESKGEVYLIKKI